MLKALLIDMDGTLADSLFFLYQVYMSFLEQHGIQGTKEEFDLLNGLTLEEVIQTLIDKYRLQNSLDELVCRYQTAFYSNYQESLEIFPDAKKCLIYAKEKKLQLALVTSASFKLANFFLNQHEICHLFDCVITSENLAEGKPSPLIYLKALQTMGLCPLEAIAIEDSDHGIESATLAGIPTIRFNPDYRKPTEKPIIADAKNWSQILQYLRSIPKFYTHREIYVRPSTLVFPRVDSIWNESLKENPTLFNGKILNFVSINDHYLESEFVEYKYWVAKLKKPELQIPIWPVAITAIVEAKSEVLIGKRSSLVSTHSRLYETAPCGCFDSISEKNGKIDVFKQLQIELFEETGITEDEILSCETMGIFEDFIGQTWEVVVRVKLRNRPKTFLLNGEYEELFFLPKKELSSFVRDHYNEIVPFSRYLLETFVHEI